MPDKANPFLKVGEVYSLSELGGLAGGAAIVPSDRIVLVGDLATDELAWKRMTVGRLIEWLQTALKIGEITDESELFVDSDPEGNDVHPMRAAAALAAVKPDAEGDNSVLDVDAQAVWLPAPAVWLKVGY